MKIASASRSSHSGLLSAAKGGNALISVLIMVVIVGGFAAISLKDSLHALRMANRQILLDQAHFVAQSGIAEAARRLSTERYYGLTPITFTFELAPGMAADVVMTPLNSRGRTFSLHSQATLEGVTREVNVGRVFLPTYLEYGTYFEDWKGLWWIQGRFVDGKVWSGTTQNIHGYTLPDGEKYGPIFRDVNETAAATFGGAPEYAAFLSREIPLDDYEYDDLRFWNDHPEHYALNAAKPALATIDFDEISSAAHVLKVGVDGIRTDLVSPGSRPSNRALVLKGPTTMRFDVDTISGTEVGVLRVINKDAFGDTNWHTLYSESLDMVVVQDNPTARWSSDRAGTLAVSNKDVPSIVKGNLSVFADRDVTIYGDVFYDDQALETSSDKLLIASKHNIYVDRTDKNDMVFQAGLIAAGLDGSKGHIGLKNYDRYGVRGKFFFTGSMVGKEVYPFGNFSGSTFLNGYTTLRFFDERFLTDPPPFTPAITAELRFEGWR